MGDWKPIDTAPKRRRVDLWGVSGKAAYRVPDCYWHRRAGRWMTAHHCREGYSALRAPFTPTHWMERPAGPDEAAR